MLEATRQTPKTAKFFIEHWGGSCVLPTCLVYNRKKIKVINVIDWVFAHHKLGLLVNATGSVVLLFSCNTKAMISLYFNANRPAYSSASEAVSKEKKDRDNGYRKQVNNKEYIFIIGIVLLLLGFIVQLFGY